MPQNFPRQTAADFDREVLDLFHEYVHGQLDRRGFLDRAARFATAAGTTSAGLLAALSPNFAAAQKVAPGDARIKNERIQIASPAGNGRIDALVARPAQAAGPLPVVLVIHENRGLNPHAEDIARRLAVDNFIAVAPDLLTSAGGYPGDEDKAREAFVKIDQTKAAEDWLAAARHARAIGGGNGRLGAVGFCYGGSIVNMLAVRMLELAAAAPFYGSPPPLDQVARIKAELAISHGGNDARLVASWPAFEAALKAAGVRYDAVIYPGAEHAFNNDAGARYDEAAAKSAWGRTIALFNRTLRT